MAMVLCGTSSMQDSPWGSFADRCGFFHGLLRHIPTETFSVHRLALLLFGSRAPLKEASHVRSIRNATLSQC